MANEMVKVFKVYDKHLAEMEKHAKAKNNQEFMDEMNRLCGIGEVIRELGWREEHKEWIKEREEIKKQLAELPKSFVHINKSDIRGETEKAYQLYDGNNGYISRKLYKEYYKWIPKSQCKIVDGEIYAPFWTLK